MKLRDAVDLIAGAVPKDGGGVWADFGAGEGTFSRALAELLGDDARVYAVDRDAASLATFAAWPAEMRCRVIPVVADLAHPFALLGLDDGLLDGALIANTLHYFREPGPVLKRLVARVKAGGRVILIEYDRRGPNPWVPYPIPLMALPSLASASGLSAPVVVASRRSTYGGDLYVAAADRLPT